MSPKVQELYLAQYEYDLQHDNQDKTKNNFLKKIVIDENAFRECNLVLWDEVRCGKNLQGQGRGQRQNMWWQSEIRKSLLVTV